MFNDQQNDVNELKKRLKNLEEKYKYHYEFHEGMRDRDLRKQERINKALAHFRGRCEVLKEKFVPLEEVWELLNIIEESVEPS